MREDKEARWMLTSLGQAMAAENRGLAYHVAARSRVRLDDDERISVALEAVCRSVAGYDPSLNIKLSTYIGAAIKTELWKAWIEQHLVRIPQHLYRPGRHRADYAARAEAASVVVSLGSIGPAEMATWEPESPDPDAVGREQEDREERAGRVRAAVARLPGRLRDVIDRRMAGATLLDVGAALGISKDSVRRREKQAHRILKFALAE